jgi:hypothetical protein
MELEPLDMRTVYKMSLEKMLHPIKKSWWFYTFWIGLWASCLIWIGYSPYILFCLAATVGIALFLQIALHLNYYLHDRHVELIIDRRNRSVTFINEGDSTVIPFDTIEIILRFQGSKFPNPYETYVFPTNFYHYYVIETKDGRKFKFSDFVTGLYFTSPVRSETEVRFLNFIK